MPYDATKMRDWQIAQAVEKKMPTPFEWRDRLGLKEDEVIPMGRVSKLDFLKIMNRLSGRNREMRGRVRHDPTAGHGSARQSFPPPPQQIEDSWRQK